VRLGHLLPGARQVTERLEVDETPELSDDDIATAILAAVRENPGASWNAIDEQVQGQNARRREVRDELLASGELVNVGGGRKFILYAAGGPASRAGAPRRGRTCGAV
jgi:hypothetical protein